MQLEATLSVTAENCKVLFFILFVKLKLYFQKLGFCSVFSTVEMLHCRVFIVRTDTGHQGLTRYVPSLEPHSPPRYLHQRLLWSFPWERDQLLSTLNATTMSSTPATPAPVNQDPARAILVWAAGAFVDVHNVPSRNRLTLRRPSQVLYLRLGLDNLPATRIPAHLEEEIHRMFVIILNNMVVSLSPGYAVCQCPIPGSVLLATNMLFPLSPLTFIKTTQSIGTLD